PRTGNACSEWIVFRGGQRRVQNSDQLLPAEWRILVAHRQRISYAIGSRNVISLAPALHRRSRAGHLQQRIFLKWVTRQTVFARPSGIHKLDVSAWPAGDVPIKPALEWICRSRAAALRRVALVQTAGRM